MFSFIKKRFLYRFIIVEINGDLVSVHTYDIKNKEVLSQVSEDFRLESSDQFTDELNDYINKKQQEYFRSYVVTLLNSQGQGIIPTCSATQFKEYNVDRRYIYNICVDNLFTNYVSKIEIKWLQKLFAQTGIDLIFSPFLILKDLADGENLDEIVLYILYVNSGVTLLVKHKQKYIYGSFFNVNSDENPLHSDYEDEDEDEDEEFEVEEFEVEDDEENFELSDEEDSEKDLVSVNEVELIESNKIFAKSLSKILRDFYSSKQYESNFIESVKFFSNEKIDTSIINFIEDELFLKTTTKLVELDYLILKYSQKEVIGV